MKSILLAILMGLTGPWGNAKEPAAVFYQIGTQHLEFIDDPSRALLITKTCKHQGQFACMAYRALEKASILDGHLNKIEGGMNPGSVVCRSLPHTSVVIGLGLNQNQRAFCVFADRSMVDLGSLFRAALDNDRKNHPGGFLSRRAAPIGNQAVDPSRHR